MTALQAACLYCGLLLVLLVYLAFRVVVQRGATKTSIGDGGHPALALAIRVHGNSAEYVPAGMVALIALALLGLPAWAIHAVGAPFVLGRILHAIGLAATIRPARAGGMVLTWLSMIAMAGGLIVHAVV